MSDFYSVQINSDDLPPADDKSSEGTEGTEGKTEGTTEEPARPSWLPEKFKSPEELAKAYENLEKKQGSSAKPKQPVEEVADKDGKVDMAKVTREYQANGELSSETRKALEKSGLSAGQIDTHLRGLQAIASETRRDVAAAIGGEEQLDNVRVWAEANLSADEIAAYDGAVKSGNTALAKLLVRGINAQYVEANGSAEPTLQSGETVPSDKGLKPFKTNQEVVEAMRNPKYKKGDREYVRSVERRLAISKVF
jgi:hypothetical protein